VVERNFSASGPNRLWVADISYIPTWAGFLYLAVVLDAFSRRIVGWAMETHLRTELVLKALNMALGQRRPAAVIHHSDHGCQGRFKRSSQFLLSNPPSTLRSLSANVAIRPAYGLRWVQSVRSGSARAQGRPGAVVIWEISQDNEIPFANVTARGSFSEVTLTRRGGSDV
jgi:hypothetical protein